MIERIAASQRIPLSAAHDAFVGFVLLLVTIAGHSMVETARDTLFLSELPVSRLPWAYLAIAMAALVVARLSRTAALHLPRSRILAMTSISGAAVTAGFWLLSDVTRPNVTFLLYVWAGLFATAMTIQFWIALSDRMEPRIAKRCFAFVALGGLLGGALGALFAGFWVEFGDPRHLLIFASGVFVAAGALPGRLSPLTEERAAGLRRKLRSQPARGALRDRYVRSLLVLALLTAIATTGIDYLFKGLAQANVPKESLASFFARFYVVVNLLALVLQMFATRHLLQVFGPTGTLAALPSLGTLGAAATGLVSGIVPVALLKGAEGVLRHSLHRTSTEVLFVPLSGTVRDPARSLAGSLGHRGGQALGSLLILAALSLELDPGQVALVLSVLCIVWFVAARRVRGDYAKQVARRAGRLRSAVAAEVRS